MLQFIQELLVRFFIQLLHFDDENQSIHALIWEVGLSDIVEVTHELGEVDRPDRASLAHYRRRAGHHIEKC